MITEIHIERHQTEVQTDLCQTLRDKVQDEYTLRMQLCTQMEEMQKELAEVKSQQESLVCQKEESERELESHRGFCRVLSMAYCCLYTQYRNMKLTYDADDNEVWTLAPKPEDR